MLCLGMVGIVLAKTSCEIAIEPRPLMSAVVLIRNIGNRHHYAKPTQPLNANPI